VSDVSAKGSPLADQLAPLEYVDVCLSDGAASVTVRALADSGAQMAVVSQDVVQSLSLDYVGSVKLRGLFGPFLEAPVSRVDVRLSSCSRECDGVPVVMAVCPDVNDQLVLPIDVVNHLLAHVCCLDACVRVRKASNDDGSGGDGGLDDNPPSSSADHSDESGDEGSPGDGDFSGGGEAAVEADKPREASSYSADTATLISEQQSDESLKQCFALAKQGKGGYFLRDGLLHKQEKIQGQLFEPLVLPVSRRQQVLKLAHDTVGAHMGVSNTKVRIKMSFCWPTIARDVKSYVATCKTCSLRRRKMCYDNVPITPIERDVRSFNHWFCDVLGPLFPNQKVDYNYCFVACDSHTRWPSAYPLRAVTAKNICDCLLKLWTTFGVSQFVTLDNASSHTAQLTRLLLEKVGCAPIFITPTHSQANGLAERTVGSIKELIHKVAFDHQRSWHKYLDFILWAMREVPQSSLGLSPYTLAFGLEPRGPIAILRDTWTGVKQLPLDLAKPVADYLCDLREKLASANEYADEHMRTSQSKWASRYNLRAHDKKFDVGEQVLILTPDSTSSRLWSRWRAPATVVEIKSPHSYIVEIDGARQHVHANKLRKYDVRVDEVVCNSLTVSDASVHSCSVIFDHDTDFGDVEEFIPPSVGANDVDCVLLPSQQIDASKLSHLTDQQRTELLDILDKYPECFAEKPGLCQLLEHEIHVTPDFKPKRLKEYRIPEKFKSEVDRQIQELLQLGLIHESTSPQASPVVCVLKGKDGCNGVRLTIDYRYVNKFSVADALGPPDMQSVMQRIGRAKFITTFDGRSSYWTIPVKREHQWLTGFIYNDRLYEWSRVPFGMKNSGCSFVRMIQRILQPIKAFADSFVDDMAVFSDQWEKHLQDLDQYLKVIKDSGLTLNLKKSSFAMPEVKFCGHYIGSGVRRIDPSKLDTVMNLQRPETKSQVRQVLGLFGWFRDYIPNYAEHALPLTELTAKRVPNLIPWSTRHQLAFDKLKRLLCDAADNQLYVCDWSKPFNIFSDASDYAVAAILSQTDDRGQERPIAFCSRKLNDTQRAWATIEKEAFAVLEAIKKFAHWIFGYKIHVFSDHNPLAYLTDAAPKSAKLLRWSLALQNFDLEFHYKAGKSPAMAAPDCLSRLGPGTEQCGPSG
jgi:hypothetical protein